MVIKIARGATEKPKGRERKVQVRDSWGFSKSSNICSFWLAGRCNRKPCRYVHGDSPTEFSNYPTAKRSGVLSEDRPRKSTKRVFLSITKGGESDCYGIEKPGADATLKSGITSCQNTIKKCGTDIYQKPGNVITRNSKERICKYWSLGNCVKGDHCQYLHAWFIGNDFSTLTKLQGHKKVISGITLPSGSDKLYSGSTDGTVRIWDCQTGQCTQVKNLGAEVGSLISEGPWVFVGIPNAVKAWNIQTSSEFSLEGPVGQVNAMVVANEMLLAGVQDGSILAWKGSCESIPFQLAATLIGHTQAVLSLAVGGKRLYTGSRDRTIRVWDLDTLQCIMTLNAHSDAVMSLICWEEYLLSCSLDCTIKVWYLTESCNLEVAYTHNEQNGLLALCGMTDADAKPILFCSSNDNSVCLYELPSFRERGKLFAKQQVRALEIGPGGLFFSGDFSGLLSVWKWLDGPRVPPSSAQLTADADKNGQN